MPTFPLPLGDITDPKAQIVTVRDVFDADQVARFDQRSRDRGVRMLPVVISVLTTVFAVLAGQPLRAVLPVHSRHEDRWHDSVGWFITNAVVESSDPDPAACTASVNEALQLGSYPLAPIMAPYGGQRVRVVGRHLRGLGRPGQLAARIPAARPAYPPHDPHTGSAARILA